ncbi:MAG: D-alanyl-D-alanine endopeptidase [Nitrosomonas sp.]|nr:D-alanyl-D-alanine endopeptidase [Nitrosomonas sp.]
MRRQLLLLITVFIFANNAFSSQTNLDLKSQSVVILDTQEDRIIYDKNSTNIMPIASITKLMTAMVTLEAKLPLEEEIQIDSADIDTLKKTSSRLKVGDRFARRELLLLALMSSENRAAAALGRTYPGGMSAFVKAMNIKALLLGMNQTHFVEPTGLSSGNVSTAYDLAKMVEAAYRYDIIRNYSTTERHIVTASNRKNILQFINSNGLVHSGNWKIDVSKTGFINEAGRCLVMQAIIKNKPVVIVLLNSWGKNTRIGDANRVRKWIEAKT